MSTAQHIVFADTESCDWRHHICLLSRLRRVISSRVQLGVENGYGIVEEFSRYTPWAVSNRSISDDRSLIGLIVSNPQYHRCFIELFSKSGHDIVSASLYFARPA